MYQKKTQTITGKQKSKASRSGMPPSIGAHVRTQAHVRTHGRTTRKHNADPMHWMGGVMKNIIQQGHVSVGHVSVGERLSGSKMSQLRIIKLRFRLSAVENLPRYNSLLLVQATCLIIPYWHFHVIHSVKHRSVCTIYRLTPQSLLRQILSIL